ncbi:hypothetical protein [Rhizobium chutanense]|nr:hypothetical protein [Rhizobium chutanense]
MKQILTPLLYLRIKHPQKSRFDVWLPLILAGVFFAAIFVSGYWSLVYDFSKKQSLLSDRILTLLSALSGFFVAALAAIATFNGKGLDDLMLGDTPTLRHGKYKNEPEKLTRRRFLSFLFGYLAFLSFVYTIMIVVAPIIGEILVNYWIVFSKNHLIDWCFYLFSGFLIYFYIFIFFHIFVITLLGLHYLSERMSRE